MQQMGKFIKSTNIFCDSESDPFSGYIQIEGEKIKRVLDDQSFLLEGLSSEKLEILDYEDLYIIPGLIDLNVHLNSNYDEAWENIESTTKMAAQGGITTIIDNPLMCKYDESFDEIKALHLRFNNAKGSLYVDCGLLALLSSHNYKNLEEIWDSGLAIGFKLYMSLNIQHDIPQINIAKKHLAKIAGQLKKTQHLNHIFLSINPELASTRDLFICSPLRSQEKEKRLNLKEELKDAEKFGGGIHGEMDDAEDSNKSSSDKDSEENKDEVADFMFTKNINIGNNITSGLLRRCSKEGAETQDQRAIHCLEMMQYNESDELTICDTNETQINSDPELNKTKNSCDDIDESEDDSEKELVKLLKIEKKSGFSKKNDEKHLDLSPLIFKEQPHELNNIFKEKIRGVIDNKSISETYHMMDYPESIPEKNKNICSDVLQEQKFGEDKKQKEKISASEPQSKASFNIRRASSLLDRRNSSKNLATKSLDINVTSNPAMKEGITKLKSNLQNSNYNMHLLNYYLSWEINGTKKILTSFKEISHVKVLISNISSANTAFLVRMQRKKIPNLNIYCETSIPYLHFYSGKVQMGEAKFKGTPPIRNLENRNLLIRGLNIQDLFHCVSSFHLQVPTRYKTIEKGNFKRCFNGFSILGFNLQVLWTKLYSPLKKQLKGNQITKGEYQKEVYDKVKKVVSLLSEKPSDLLGLQGRKGKIREGYDADFVVWDPFAIEEIDMNKIHLRYKKVYLLKYQKVHGKVMNTFLRGKCVFSQKDNIPIFHEKIGKILVKD